MDAASIHSTGSGGSTKSRRSKFLPKGLSARRRWQKQSSRESVVSANSSEHDQAADPRGRSRSRRASAASAASADYHDDGPTSPPPPVPPLPPQLHQPPDASAPVFDLAVDGPPQEVRRAEDVRVDPPLNTSPDRPTFGSTHPSHIGQLTTSSPIIRADHVPDAEGAELHPHDSHASSHSSASFAPGLPELQKPTIGLQPPNPRSTHRSRSPAGRIRDAFRGRKSTSPSDDIRPATAPATDDRDTSDPDATTDPDSSVALDSDAAAVPTERPRASSTWAHPPDTSLPFRREAHASALDSTERKRRPKSSVVAVPQTPPSIEPPAPVIVNTPPTPTESQTDLGSRSRRGSSVSFNHSNNPNVVVSHGGQMISHRRVRSGSSTAGPSKLSNITTAPLTPTPENGPPQAPGTGFFSNVFSAAQNAATTFTTSLTGNHPSHPNRPDSKSRDGVPQEDISVEDDGVRVEPAKDLPADPNMSDEKELAVKTLGSGELSLSALGLDEDTPTTPRNPNYTTDGRRRSESAPGETPTAANGDAPVDDFGGDRPRSILDQSTTSPTASVYDGKSGIHRSGSIRSAMARRRKRGSTGGTGNTAATTSTVGLAIAAANASVAHPAANGSAPKLTGFAVASKKRNRDFHSLFKSVPDDDYLIEDYSCALQREILAHGRLYVSEGHICFSSNIFGWVTTLVMSFDEIVAVEKRSTALVFKNGLMITTLHAKHVFASFTSRDSTYDLIVNIWKLGHPTLQSSLNGVSIDEPGGDRTVKVAENDAAIVSQSVLASDDEMSEDGDVVYDEDEDDEDDHAPDAISPAEGSPADPEGDKSMSRKVSGAVATNGAADKMDGAAGASALGEFPGPATHAPTECGDVDTHYEVVVGDDTVSAPLGKIYDLMFGPGSVSFMSKWLTNEQKCTDLQMEDKKGLTLENKSRSFTYIKPLYASIGPKQTKCITTETLENLDLEKSVNVVVTTQNPDVPSGNVFCVKTRYCLFWGENNSTRVTINCTIEWSGKSWLKGPIEKGAKDGQTQYCKDIFAHLKGSLSTRTRGAAPGAPGGKGKKKKAKKMQQPSKESLNGAGGAAVSTPHDWGLLQPLQGILEPIADILKPVFTGNVVYGLLVGLLVASWFGFGFNGRSSPTYGRDVGFMGYPERAVAYEEIWRREESELWDWLEERVGLHRMSEDTAPTSKRAMEPRTVQEKVRDERMNEREVEEAIRVTEEKLAVLKASMPRNKVVSSSRGQKDGDKTKPDTGASAAQEL